MRNTDIMLFFTMSLKGGAQQVSQKLAARLPQSCVLLDHPVLKITQVNGFPSYHKNCQHPWKVDNQATQIMGFVSS